jgi:toxin YoeB
MNIVFLIPAWEDYLYWQQHDKVLLKKVNTVIKEIQQSPFDGSGKPEPLKHDLSGWWSRRLSLEHRIVYKVEDNAVTVLQCRYHY